MASEAVRSRTVFDAVRLFRAVLSGACALIDSPPALERRRIAAPRLSTGHLALNLAHMEGPRPIGARGRYQALGRAGRHGPCLTVYRISGSSRRFRVAILPPHTSRGPGS